MDCRIRYLADCPELVPVLARWVFDEWREQYRISSVDDQIELFMQRTNRNRFPLALVAFSGDEPVGTASLKLREMTTHTHLVYWLGAVFVTKDMRNRGIGTALVECATAAAQQLAAWMLYLHTSGKVSLYSRLGWVEMERCLYSGHEVVIMKKELA